MKNGYEELAEKYRITEEECRKISLKFLQSEGFFETRKGIVECETIEEYIVLSIRSVTPDVIDAENIACETGKMTGAQ